MSGGARGTRGLLTVGAGNDRRSNADKTESRHDTKLNTDRSYTVDVSEIPIA